MPIEILELIVKADVTEDKIQKGSANPAKEQMSQLFDKELLMEEILEQVIAMLVHKKER